MNGKYIIPEQIGGSEYLFNDFPAIGAIKIIDGIIAFAPAVISIYAVGPFLPSGYEFISGLVALTLGVIGFLALLLKPNHISLKEHIERTYNFKFKTDKKRRNVLADGGIQDFVDKEDEIEPFDSESLENLTGIKKFHPHHNALERPDGTVVGALQVHGNNLSLAMGEERTGAITELAGFVNNELEDIGKIQLYLPLKQFDASLQINNFSKRIDDEDVKNNKIMQLYIDDRIQEVSSYEGMLYREYYVLVELTSTDYKKVEMGASEKIERLRRVSDILAEIWLEISASTGLTDEEFKGEQLEQLTENMSRMKSAIERMTNNNVERLSANELTSLNAEEWRNINTTQDEREEFLQTDEYIITDYERAKAKLNENEGGEQ